MSVELQPYEDILRDRYVTQKKGLKEVMEYMKNQYNIDCSKNQYERQFKHWNFRKHLSKDDWHFVQHRIEKRKREGKDSELYFQNALVPTKKVRKETSRNVSLTHEYYNSASPRTPQDLFIRTPKSAYDHFARHNNLPWNRFVSYFESQGFTSLFEIGPLKQGPGQFSSIESPSALDDMRFNFLNYPLGIQHDKPLGDLSVIRKNPMLSRLRSSIVESHDGPILEFFTALTGPRKTSTIVRLVACAVFLASNSLIEGHKIWNIVDGIIDKYGQSTLLSLCSNNSPTTVAFSQQVFKEALRSRRTTIVKELLENISVQRYIRSSAECLKIAIRGQEVDMKIVNMLIKADCKINGPARRYDSILELALEKDNLDLILTLINSGARHEGEASLIGAVKSVEVLQALLDAGYDPNGQWVLYGGRTGKNQKVTVLQAHSYYGNTEIVRCLSLAGANINEPPQSDQGDTALSLAIRRDHTDTVKALLDLGADIDLSEYWHTRTYSRHGHWFETLIGTAVFNDNIQMVTLLIDYGADTNHANQLGRTALEIAVSQRQTKLVKMLLENGSDANIPSYFNADRPPQSSLMTAIMWDDIEIVEDLLNAGADVNVPEFDDHWSTAYEAAFVLESNPEIKAILLRFGATIESDGAIEERRLLEIYENVKVGNLSKVQKLLETGVNVNKKPWGYRNTILTRAIKYSNEDMTQATEIVQILVDHGADINMPFYDPDFDEYPTTALLEAILVSPFSIIQLLLNLGGNLNSSSERICEYVSQKHLLHLRTDLRQNPLALFIIRCIDNTYEALPLLELLLESGAPIAGAFGNATAILEENTLCFDDEDFTEIYTTVFQVFLKAGADINDRSSNTRTTMLSFAISSGHQELVVFLLENGADVQLDQHLVQEAVFSNESDSFEIVKLLVDHKATANTYPDNDKKWTALQQAASTCRGNLDLVEYLLKAGANINAPPAEEKGITALQGAAIQGHLGIASLLIDAGADVNMPGAKEDGRTALEGASENGRLDMVQLLLNSGADSHLPEEERYLSSIAYAEKENHFAIVDVLNSYRI